MPTPARDPAAPPRAARSLDLRFADAHTFRSEYERNLAKGGAFVPTGDRFAPREVVEVRLEASFAGETLALTAEVVADLPPNGVAVQFLLPGPELRARLAGLLATAERVAGASQPVLTDPDDEDPEAMPGDLGALLAPAAGSLDLGLVDDEAGLGPGGGAAAAALDPNERTFVERAERAPVRARVRVQGPTGKPLEARTRDLSRSGLLLSAEGEELPLGRDVELEITHPGTGEAHAVTGRVVRHLEGPGVIPAVAIQMRPGVGPGREALEQFLDDVQRADAEQRHGGIRGPLEEVGAAGLLQMLAALSRQGTLIVASGVEEGAIVFEDGRLLAAQLGAVTGVKALARVFAWREGTFEFRAHCDPVARGRPGERIEAAVLEALRLVDEARRAAPALAPETRFAVRHDRLQALAEPLGKTEEAVLELAAAGFTLRRILDVIPEDDGRIQAAVAALLEADLLRRAP
jgi:hypothetical protein